MKKSTLYSPTEWDQCCRHLRPVSRQESSQKKILPRQHYDVGWLVVRSLELDSFNPFLFHIIWPKLIDLKFVIIYLLVISRTHQGHNADVQNTIMYIIIQYYIITYSFCLNNSVQLNSIIIMHIYIHYTVYVYIYIYITSCSIRVQFSDGRST